MRAIAPCCLATDSHIRGATAVGTVCINEPPAQGGRKVRTREVLDCTVLFAMVDPQANAHPCIPGQLLEAEQRTGVGEADERRRIHLQRR